MYINFWYPIALSTEITNEKPLAVKIMSLDFVAFRDTQGKAHVLSNTCIHRGAALARWIEEGLAYVRTLPPKQPKRR